MENKMENFPFSYAYVAPVHTYNSYAYVYAYVAVWTSLKRINKKINRISFSSFRNSHPDLLRRRRHKPIDRFHFLSFYKLKLEAFNENRQEHQSLRDRESPCGALASSSKSKRLVSEVWKLFDILWAEAIWIKPWRRNYLTIRKYLFAELVIAF